MLGHRFPGLIELKIEADASDRDHAHSRQDCNRVGNVVVLLSTRIDVVQDDEVVLGGWLLQRDIAGCAFSINSRANLSSLIPSLTALTLHMLSVPSGDRAPAIADIATPIA